MMIHMFNVSQLYSITLALKANFEEVNYNKRVFYHDREKNEILGSSITFLRSHFLQDIKSKNVSLVNKKSI